VVKYFLLFVYGVCKEKKIHETVKPITDTSVVLGFKFQILSRMDRLLIHGTLKGICDCLLHRGCH